MRASFAACGTKTAACGSSCPHSLRRSPPSFPPSLSAQSLAQQELEAYRRAESAERAARERAGQLLAQIDAILSGSPLQSTDAQLEQACGQLNQDLAAVQAAVSAVHTSLDGIRTQLQTLSHPE